MTRSLPPMFAPGIATAGLPAMRDMSGAWRLFHGIDAGERDAYESLADFARAPADEAWVYRCVTIRFQAAQSVPLKVYLRRGKDRIPVEETGDAAGEDLQFLLDDANPVSMSGSDLKAYTEAGISVWGGSYWRKVRGRLGGPPQELHWLRTPDVDPVMGRTAPDAYTYGPTGSEAERYQRRDIVPFVRPNLVNQFRPLSPLSAARFDIGTSVMASKRTEALLRNWSIPPGAWVAPKDAEITRQDKNLITRWLRNLRGPKQDGKVPVLPEGLTWQAMALTPQDAEWLAARKVSRLTVCAAMQVPLVLAGDDEKSGVYRSMLDAERVFWRGMITELDWYADQVQSWLVPDFDPTRRQLLVGWDYSGVEALQEPEGERKKTALLEVQSGTRRQNEYRKEFAIGEPVPWGDVWWATPQTVQVADDKGALTIRPVFGSVQDTTAVPGSEPAPDEGDEDASTEALDAEAAAAALRAVGALYRHPAVRAYLAGAELDTDALLGGRVDDTVRGLLETGLTRRYSTDQLADGVPAEAFPGLRTRTAA